MPFGFLVMLLFYCGTECKQLDSAGEAVSPEEAWGISLGLLPPWMYDLHFRDHRYSVAQRSRSTGTPLSPFDLK